MSWDQLTDYRPGRGMMTLSMALSVGGCQHKHPKRLWERMITSFSSTRDFETWDFFEIFIIHYRNLLRSRANLYHGSKDDIGRYVAMQAKTGGDKCWFFNGATPTAQEFLIHVIWGWERELLWTTVNPLSPNRAIMRGLNLAPKTHLDHMPMNAAIWPIDFPADFHDS